MEGNYNLYERYLSEVDSLTQWERGFDKNGCNVDTHRPVVLDGQQHRKKNKHTITTVGHLLDET